MYSNSQQGTSLIEALIAMILISLVGSGAIHLTNRATASHTDQQLLTMAITQMRAALNTPNVCTTPPVIQLPNNVSLTTQVQGCGTTSVTIGVGGGAINVQSPLTLSVTSDLLGGQVVVGGTWRSS